MATIAAKVERFFPVCPKELKRYVTAECRNNAKGMLDAYLKYNMISKVDYDSTLKEIKNAPHDDAISDIMAKVRKRAKW